MSHAIDMSNGRANMAYAEGTATPWHKLGHIVPTEADRETWSREAGLNFSVSKGVLCFEDERGLTREASEALNRSVLYRDDTKAPLSVMSQNFQIHQPAEIFDFVSEIVREMGWTMETAGSLHGGRRIWALANIGEDFELPGGDRVSGYFLAATSFDGSIGSEFRNTAIRVVCSNTLGASINERGVQTRVKVYHSSALDVQAVKTKLGFVEKSWTAFIEKAKVLAAIHLTKEHATEILRTVFDERTPREIEINPMTGSEFIEQNRVARKALELWDGQMIGFNMASTTHTAWGLTQAVAELYDHHGGAKADRRIDSALFGTGDARKAATFAECLKIA
jgi:phage/plasmid-like protein (TIGR03299 family)